MRATSCAHSELTLLISVGPEGEPDPPSHPLLVWYGDKPPDPPPWLIRDTLPQMQVAILAGQFSAGKTFVAIDLALSVMTGRDFAGRAAIRTGAVLWLAAEGQNEVDVRLKAAALNAAGRDMAGELPFTRQAFGVPQLTDDDALPQLAILIDEARRGLAERFPGVDLVMIVIDTLNSAAGFQDANSGAEAQKVMNLLRQVSQAAGALVLVIDHFGKLVETGVKGSQNKSDSSDAILTALSDRDAAGSHSNRRLTVFKVRNGPSGAVIPFKLCPVAVDGDGGTSCAVTWNAEPSTAAPAPSLAKPAWAGRSRILKAAIERALIEHGKPLRPFGSEGPEVKAVERDKVRAEFYASYAADDAGTKRKAFNRLTDEALVKALIASREIAGSDWLWLVVNDPRS